MNFWRPVPLLRLVFPFLSGIILGQVFKHPLPVLLLPSVLIVLNLLLILLHWFALSFKLRWMSGSVILAAFVVSGFYLSNISAAGNKEEVPDFESKLVLLVRISDCPVLKKNCTAVVCDLLSIHDSGRWKPFNSKLYLRVYNSKNSGSAGMLNYGDYYLVYGRPEKLKFFTNSHSFNFREYLFSKGLRYEQGSSLADCKRLPGNHGMSVSRFAFGIRDRLLGILRQKGIAGQEFSVAAALLLGYVDDIDSRLKSAFAASGTMHILSVSGMHVGIIFMFLETALSFLAKFRKGIYLKSLIELLFIWVYAAVTGFSPAVLRASASLGFLIIGKTIRRKPEMLNVISASVFFLLIMNPSILTDVGFQLSYLAVTGIVLLYKPIYDLYVTHHWLPNKIWALMAVSIAAQIATLPLSLYYFHRFPNYFIISNLVIVPLSNGIILMGILALALSSLPFIGNLVIMALKLLLIGLNKSVMWIASLPGSVTSGFFPDIPEVVLLYLIIISAFLFFTVKQPKFLLLALSCLLMLELHGLAKKFGDPSPQRLFIHQGSQGYVVRLVKGRREVCFYSGLRMMKDPFISTQVGSERLAGNVDIVQDRWINFNGWQKACGFPRIGRFGNMMVAGDRRIFILDSPLGNTLKLKTHADILLICSVTGTRIEKLKEIFTPAIILNVSTAFRSRVLLWSDEARKCRILFYDLRSAGFYQEQL
jgi:competence protein ComEC